MSTAPELWREAKAAMDDAARAYLAGAPDAVERAERALALIREAESAKQDCEPEELPHP